MRICTLTMLRVSRARRSVNALAVHPSGGALATGGDDQRVVLYAPDSARRWLGDLPQAWLPARGGDEHGA